MFNKANSKTILITGCSSGIGLCAAQTLKARGYDVFATARKAEDIARLQAMGLHGVTLDLDDSASIEAAVQTVLQQTDNRLDALFNNSGFAQPGAIEDLSRDVIRQQFETNVFGTIELTNRVIPIMREQGHGRIVFNSSLLGLVAMAYRGAYNASKFALEGFAQTLRQELHGSGIHVSLIEPGPIKSQFRDNARDKFLASIATRNSYHMPLYQAMNAAYRQNGHNAAFMREPQAVVKKLLRALESRFPKPHYYVTSATHMLVMLKRLLPHRVMDYVLRQIAKRA